jgi:hypothetical protein
MVEAAVQNACNHRHRRSGRIHAGENGELLINANVPRSDLFLSVQRQSEPEGGAGCESDGKPSLPKSLLDTKSISVKTPMTIVLEIV